VSAAAGAGAGLDELLDRLEKAIARLADGTAPLDQLISAHAEAHRLARQAEDELKRLSGRLAEKPEP